MVPQLQPATYFLEMNPGSANRPNSRLAGDIASADWLVLSHQFDGWNEPNESVKPRSDQPMRVVHDQFELCGQYGSRDLYRRRRPIEETKKVLRLPCLAFDGLAYFDISSGHSAAHLTGAEFSRRLQDVERTHEVLGD